MFKTCQEAQCGWNTRCDRGEAGHLDGHHTIGEAIHSWPSAALTSKLSRSNPGLS